MMDNLARRQFRLVGKENSEVSIVKQIKCTVSNEWKVSVRRVSNFFWEKIWEVSLEERCTSRVLWNCAVLQGYSK
jgi:hypothetical protein